MTRPPFEVADIIRAHGNSLIEKSQAWLTWLHIRVLFAIEHCRTATLGGHLDRCRQCDHEAISFNSCLMGSIFFWGVGWRDPRNGGPFLMISTAATHHKLKALYYVGSAVYGHAQRGEPMLETYFSAPKTLGHLRREISGPDS